MGKKTITEVTYNYDEHTGKMIGKTIVETVTDRASPVSDDVCDAEPGVILEACTTLPRQWPRLQTLVTVMASGALGILLYRAFQ